MTSVILSIVFLLAALAVLAAGLIRSGRAAALLRDWWPAGALAAVILLTLTAVFDNIMIAVGLFDYDWENMSGLILGRMPVDDFAYPLAALLLLPGLWLLLSPRRGEDRS
ncbi:lycopene cyclase domain-containing protein [Microbacterium sp. MC2]